MLPAFLNTKREEIEMKKVVCVVLLCMFMTPVSSITGNTQELKSTNEQGNAVSTLDDGYIEFDGSEASFPTTGKIRLTNDVEIKGQVITVTGDLIIDLNGKNLSARWGKNKHCYFEVNAGASLQFLDSQGTGQVDVKTYESYFIHANGGEATIAAGTWKTSNPLLYVTNGGSIVLTNGDINFLSLNLTKLIIVDGYNSRFLISGGTLSLLEWSQQTSIIEATNGATVEMTGGAINGIGYLLELVRIKDSVFKMSGGEIHSGGRNGTNLYVCGGGKAYLSDNAWIENTSTYGMALLIYANIDLVNPGGYVEMNGGTVLTSGIESGIAVKIDRVSEYVNGGTLIFNDGKIKNISTSDTSRAIDMQGKLQMNGGRVLQSNEAYPAIVNTASRIDFIAEVEINGGQIDASNKIFDDLVTKIPPKISGGVFSHPVTEYVVDGKNAIRYEKDNIAVYAVGNEIEKIVENAKAGETVTVLKSGESLKVPDQVKVKNETTETITVNGLTIAADKEIVVHNFDEAWEYDQSKHWHQCKDCPVKGEGAHHFTEWTIIKNATYHETGKKQRACKDCGYKQIQTIELLTQENEIGTVVKTGDETNQAGWYQLMLGSLIGMIAIMMRKSQKMND